MLEIIIIKVREENSVKQMNVLIEFCVYICVRFIFLGHGEDFALL